jgi:hypothetical protein
LTSKIYSELDLSSHHCCYHKSDLNRNVLNVITSSKAIELLSSPFGGKE